MKKQTLIAGVLLCGSLCIHAAEVQGFVVKGKGDAQTTYALSNVRKITFSGSTMSVTTTDAGSENYVISEVEKLFFQNVDITGIKEAGNASLKAYPNPAKDVLNVADISKVENIALYNIAGNELNVSYSQETNGLQIKTTSLPQGLYLLRINNQTLKFQKQ